jgi:hypothetical protein
VGVGGISAADTTGDSSNVSSVGSSVTILSDLDLFLCFFLLSVSDSRLRLGGLDVSESGGVTFPFEFEISGDDMVGLGNLEDFLVFPPLALGGCGVSWTCR